LIKYSQQGSRERERRTLQLENLKRKEAESEKNYEIISSLKNPHFRKNNILIVICNKRFNFNIYERFIYIYIKNRSFSVQTPLNPLHPFPLTDEIIS